MTTILEKKPATFDWKLWPQTEAFVDGRIAKGLEGNAFAAGLAERMRVEASTRFADWVDHLSLRDQPRLREELATLGYRARREPSAGKGRVFDHDGGIFPRLLVEESTGPEVRRIAIKVESVADFSRAHDLGLKPMGEPLGPYRTGTIAGEGTDLVVVERRGYLGFDAFPGDLAKQGRMRPQGARDALAAYDLWAGRRRRFDDDEEGFDATETTLERVIEITQSRDLACHLVFEAERAYWQSRNRAARVQKARQDQLGLGWANHDHHTFRSSRKYFPRLMRLFESLGFEGREKFHAGEHAGWGAQILEHPTTGIVIFADLDLEPEEADHDFAHQALPDLDRPHTVGLWVALHGESILEAGMHHLEAQFDFEGLREALKTEANVETMKPFSDFPFLRQAFTSGERWKVHKRRADDCLKRGWIHGEQHEKFLREGTIGSHLENLQRSQGYKGFNQNSVSAILAATDPRLH